MSDIIYIPRIPRDDLIHIEFKDTTRDMSFQGLRRRLVRAMKDGNTSKTKYRIVFNSTSGIMSVRTTIWMVGKDYILLKGNIWIPISAIKQVE